MAVKVKRSGVPLLVIGLGGTGKDVALQIKRTFQERFEGLDPQTLMPPETAFLVLDDDVTGVTDDPTGITRADHLRISVPGMCDIFMTKNFSEYETGWIDREMTPTATKDGAGGVRQIGRMQLIRNVDRIVQRLEEKLGPILGALPTAPKDTTSFNVLICASLSGGTGSGTALDMAYIVREVIARNHSAYTNSMKLYGMFVMPQVIFNKSGYEKNNAFREEEMQGNAYAAMKEIDYWMRQEDHGQKLPVQYSASFKTTWDRRPFDYLGYLGHTWEDGQEIRSPYDHALRVISEMMLLLSSEMPQVDASGNIAHNIYSNMSNMDKTIPTLESTAPYPVSARVVSMGMSEYSSTAMGIADYEREKTLQSVLAVPMLDPETGASMSTEEADLKGIQLIRGILTREDAQEEFFRSLKAQTSLADTSANTPEAYMEGKLEELLEGVDFSREGLQAAGRDYSDRIVGYFRDVRPDAQKYYVSYFSRLWRNFVEQSKKYIRNIQCGPICYAEFLEKVYVPDLETAMQECSEVDRDENSAIVNDRVMACEQTYRDITTGDLVHRALVMAKLKDYLDRYADACHDLADACSNNCRLKGKQVPLRDYHDKIVRYLKGLKLLIAELRDSMEEANGTKPQDDLTGSDLTFEQLRAYLDGHMSAGAQASLGSQKIAQARDNVLELLADTSFQMPMKDGQTNLEQAKLLQEMAEKVKSFVEEAFTKLKLGSLDTIVDAASQQQEEDPANYMATKVAPRMEAASSPTLKLKKAPAQSMELYRFRHTSVPVDAPVVQQGLAQYNNNGVTSGSMSRGDYTASQMTDRMLHLKMHAGIAMYLMEDVYVLREKYEAVLGRPMSDPCRGIHLVNTVKCFNGLKDGREWSLDRTWLKLPSPIPPTEIEKKSDAEKATEAYLEDLFDQAVESGIVVFETVSGAEPYDPFTNKGAVSLANEVMRVSGMTVNGDPDAIRNMHALDIKAAIDQIYEDESRSEEERLELLHAMHKSSTLKPLHYGNYIKGYGTALHLTPVMQQGNESPIEREAIAKRYVEVRRKFCAWMLSMYPEYLYTVETALDAFKHLHEKEQALNAVVERNKRMLDLAERFCLPFVAQAVDMDIWTFRIANHGKMEELFDCDLDRFGKQDRDYWEALFLMQYEEHESGFNQNLKRLVAETQSAYPADFKQLRAKELLLPKEPDPFGHSMLAMMETWRDKLSALQSDMTMDILRREAFEGIYRRLIATIETIKKSYDYWHDFSTAPAAPAPVAAFAAPAFAAPAPVAAPAAAPAAPAAAEGWRPAVVVAPFNERQMIKMHTMDAEGLIQRLKQIRAESMMKYSELVSALELPPEVQDAVDDALF